MLNLSQQDDIDKMYLYAKDLNEAKYKFLIKKREDAGIKHFNDLNEFVECSSTMDDVYEIIDEYNQNRQRKILIVFDGVIVHIITNKNFQVIVFISLVFTTQFHFSIPKDVRLTSTHYLIMKINNRKEL